MVIIGVILFVAWVSNNPEGAGMLGILILILAFAVGGLWYWRRRKRIERARFHARNLGELLVLTPTQFEHAIGALLTSLGYREVKVSGKAGDLMADITCQNSQGLLVVCQCKRWGPGHSVGTPEVQAFIGMRHAHYGAAEGIFVTTSSFTAPARALAKQHGVTLMDGTTLTTYMQQLVHSKSPQ
ncbi:restriction endonuclease [Arthrobacter bambusae]|uniref:restriction endonuclease n=1 Tax=Arthrobacter bambusae TaxID=1338426 RepID=UPI002781172D|nr:restriction endonuclease [Arthrobacter bambusae]MDQ0030137.1 restriction system protein [Arthrobacter bambusae]